jgi:hypothetical protein
VSQSNESEAAERLRSIAGALVREIQLENWQRELADKAATLQRQKEAAEKEARELRAVLDADPELTAVARQMMSKAVELRGSGDHEFSIYNPKYVTAEDKRRLLWKILRDFHLEHPESDAMSFAAIRLVLESRYGIQTSSAGMFFRHELKDWKTRGGNKKKEVLIDLSRLGSRGSG